MAFPRLSFRSHLGLAILSGMLPAYLDLANLFGSWDVDDDLYLAPYAVSMAVLLLAPFTRGCPYRITRILFLIVFSTANLVISYWLADRVFDFELGVGLAIVLSTVAMCLATAILASIRITVRYFVSAVVASLAAALVFPYVVFDLMVWFCFDSCVWWNDLYWIGAWVAWHTSIFLAINAGFERGPSSQSDTHWEQWGHS